MTSIVALLIAQSLGEYGGMGGALVEAWNGLWGTVTDLVHGTSTGTWLIVVLGVVVLWLFLRGRR